ncbi:MAG TPA: hypothetical protein VHX44_09195 [Planctomycetota bacterium]|nr:hypothetical protein [Planctomycetota bacterium]
MHHFHSTLCLLLTSALTLAGAEALKEGFHDKVPVPDTAWTYDAYLPKGYDAHPDRQYPTLFLSSPGANPDSKPWHSWADRRGMVVICINDTKNEISFKEIDKIQDATLIAAAATVRIHRVLRYSSGVSGGGWCSIRLGMRHPDAWAGVEISAHSGNGDVAPKTCAIAMYSGRADNVHSFSAQEAAANLYRSTGNPVRFVAHDGGHIYGDVNKDLTPLIDFCYCQTVVALPLLTGPERTAMIGVLKEDLARIGELNDATERRTRCEEMAAIPQLTKSPLGVELAATWIAAVQAQGKDGELRDRHFALGTAVNDPLFAGAPKDARKQVQEDLKTLQKDKALKDEVKALQMLAKVQAMETEAGSNPTKQAQVIDGYRQIAEKLGATRAGEVAAKHKR